jgi:hypothetical protein
MDMQGKPAPPMKGSQRALFDALPELTMVLGPDLSILDVNRSRAFGHDRETLCKLTATQLFFAKDLSAAFKERTALVTMGRNRDGSDESVDLRIGRLGELTILVVRSLARSQKLADLEREHIARVLEQANGNRTRAAALLGVSRATLKRRLRLLLGARGAVSIEERRGGLSSC